MYEIIQYTLFIAILGSRLHDAATTRAGLLYLFECLAIVRYTGISKSVVASSNDISPPYSQIQRSSYLNSHRLYSHRSQLDKLFCPPMKTKGIPFNKFK